MVGLTWARGVARRPARLLLSAVGVALAVALLASIGMFLGAAKATMTASAARTVAVDWQVQAAPGSDPAAVASIVAGAPGVASTAVVSFAEVGGFRATVGGTTQTTGAGIALGLPDDYTHLFPQTIRPLSGGANGVLLAQQTAANLHAGPGDVVTIDIAGLPPASVTIAGVVDLPSADSMFQVVGAPTGAQPQAPPDNVMLLPDAVWHGLFDPVVAIRPDLAHTQVHAALSGHLPPDPAAAYGRVTGMAHHLEAQLAGRGTVADNLAAALSSARADALYAQVLFLFLGLPGVVLAGLLVATVAAAGGDRRRRQQALLRTRGATTTGLVRLALVEATVVGVIGALAGLAVAAVVGRLAFGTWRFGATTATALAWSAAAVVVGVITAAFAIALPARRDARSLTVTTARAAIGRPRLPLWARLGLDGVLLATAAGVFWLTSRSGYQLVIAPEGVPSISVSYWALAGPALLWAGAGLLTWRLTELFLRRSRATLTRGVAPFSGPLAPTVAASLQRQRRILARGAALVAMTVAFAASTAVFNATYRQQVGVEALLTNGADITVTTAPGAPPSPTLASRLRATPGVRHVEPMQHRFAYVGSDLQDLYGVNPATIVDATRLQDAYFVGGTARQLIGRLAAQTDAVLVSAETVRDYQLHPGDHITLRLQDARTKQYVGVPFQYVGVNKEFPTAPSDSFLVANATYVASATGNDAVDTYLVTARDDITGVADAVRASVGATARVTDLVTSRHVVGSSLTAVDLAGLTRVELSFAVALAAAATGLVLWLGLAERRRTYAIAAALGARRRQLGAFVWSETGVVTAAGLLAGVVGGALLSRMLVKVLTGVFDPPPATLSVPWRYLGVVTIVAVASAVTAAGAALRSARRPALELLRDL